MADVYELIANGPPPDREQFIGPWFQAGDLVMLYAPRGAGKTRVSLKLAHTLCSGSEFAGYKVPRPIKVAYFDGEMGSEQMSRILVATDEAARKGFTENTFFMYTYDRFDGGQIPDISQPAGQALYDKLSKGCEVIVIDNLLSCCQPAGRNDNDVEQWGRILQWLLRKRKAGVAVLIIHHAGKSGDQLGTSVRENALDTVVQLKPSRCAKDSEYGVEWHFTKSRNFFGEDALPLNVTFQSADDGIQDWKAEKLWDAQTRVFWEYEKKYGKQVAKEYLNLQGWEVAKLEYEGDDLETRIRDYMEPDDDF